jgi:VanZ family protein
MRVAWWAAAVGWAVVIFTFSTLPGSQVPGRYGSLAHFLEYAILGAVVYVALQIDTSPTRALVLAVLITSAYGISDEFHQAFVPMRVPDPMDWLIDTLGALSGALAARRFVQRGPRANRQ